MSGSLKAFQTKFTKNSYHTRDETSEFTIVSTKGGCQPKSVVIIYNGPYDLTMIVYIWSLSGVEINFIQGQNNL